MLKLGKALGSPVAMPTFDHLFNLKSLPPVQCSDGDVNTVLGAFALDDLKRLDTAFTQGLVVRRIFHAGAGRGCLLYHLNNAIVSFGAQTAYFAKDKEAYRASQQLIAAWDSDQLSDEHMRNLLSAAIRARESRPRHDPWQTELGDGPESPERAPAPNRDRAAEPGRPAIKAKADNRHGSKAKGKLALCVAGSV